MLIEQNLIEFIAITVRALLRNRITGSFNFFNGKENRCADSENNR